jgi:hypothetical protein
MRCIFLCIHLFILSIWAIIEFIWLLLAIPASIIYCSIATRNYDESHGLLHHFAVTFNIVHIAWAEHVDLHHTILLLIAAMVHDSVDHKYCKTDAEKEAANSKLMNFLAWTVGTWDAGRVYIWITHSSYSKEKARAIQMNNGIPNKKTLGVPESERLYTRILADADRIDSISADQSSKLNRPMGIERCYQFTKNAIPTLPTAEHWKLVIKHCEDKLNDLDKWILTKRGKELAEPGVLAVRQWYTKYEPIYKTQ